MQWFSFISPSPNLWWFSSELNLLQFFARDCRDFCLRKEMLHIDSLWPCSAPPNPPTPTPDQQDSLAQQWLLPFSYTPHPPYPHLSSHVVWSQECATSTGIYSTEAKCQILSLSLFVSFSLSPSVTRFTTYLPFSRLDPKSPYLKRSERQKEIGNILREWGRDLKCFHQCVSFGGPSTTSWETWEREWEKVSLLVVLVFTIVCIAHSWWSMIIHGWSLCSPKNCKHTGEPKDKKKHYGRGRERKQNIGVELYQKLGLPSVWVMPHFFLTMKARTPMISCYFTTSSNSILCFCFDWKNP